jgi:hypothetical protein
VESNLGPLSTAATDWPTVPAPRWLWWWRIWLNEDWQGKSKYSEKTHPSATLSTTNPTWPDPGLNPGRRGGKPATNRLSCGTASYIIVLLLQLSPYIGEIIGNHQCGFQCNRWLLLTVHKIFTGFEEDCNSVMREMFYSNILIEFGMCLKLVSLIKMNLNEKYCGI